MRRKSVASLILVTLLVLMFFPGGHSLTDSSPLEESHEGLFRASTNDTGEVVVVTVDSTNLRFSPDTITLTEGDSVRFFWSGELLPHNAVEENGLFDSGEPERNVDYTYTFSVGENGTYQYVCEPHESLGMVGTIIVEPIPFVEPEPEPADESDDNATSMSVGSVEIPSILFTPWFIAMFVLVGFITIRRDDFQLSLVLEDDSETIVAELVDPEGETLVDSYRARVLTLCALYVAQGIPWGFITVTFVTFLAVEGVAAGELAFLLTMGTLPWSLKFLWGPVIDRYQFRGMGRRRPWILIAQTGMIALLTAMMFIPDPAGNVRLIAFMFLIYNIFTSLQDVSTDALAVDVLKPHEMEKVNSYMFTCKTVGGIIGGAGLGTIISIVGIKGAILLQIPILVVIMLVPLYMRERPGDRMFPWSPDEETAEMEVEERDFKEILSKVKTAFSIRSARLGIVASLVMSLSFFLIPVLPLLFVRELGWTQEQFNATKGGIILGVTMLGYLVGGQLGKRYGGKAVLIYSALATSVVTVCWGLGESTWGNGFFMMTMWSLRTFLWSLMTINIYSLMMRVTWGEVGGTQFTGYMAMMNLSAIIGYQLTDVMTSNFDYGTLFLFAALLETVVILAVLDIDPDETRRVLETSESESTPSGVDKAHDTPSPVVIG